MDRLANLTRGVNDTTPIPGQNCTSDVSSLLLNKFLVTTPSWESVSQDLRWMFSLHTYAFACFFFILSFYTFFSFLNLRSLISTPPLMSSINIFLCLLGASRSGCLFIDPYSIKEIMPRLMGTILWDVGFPFITSAFCLIQLAFFQLTQVKFGLERFQKETYLSLMIIFHFTCVIISDISLAFHVSYMVKYAVQTVFLIWALALYVIFLYAGYKVKSLLKNLPSSLLARDTQSANQKGIMQLAMLAPYNNLATSVAAALVPTLLGPAKLKALDDAAASSSSNAANAASGPDTNPSLNSTQRSNSGRSSSRGPLHEFGQKQSSLERTPLSPPPHDEPTTSLAQQQQSQPISTVPEVYVRPPTPTPSIANLPIITVSSPSRRSSLASRRGSDVSRNSRRASECSVRFVNDEESSAADPASGKRSPEPESTTPRHSPSLDRPRSPETGILRRNSDCPIPSPDSSSRDLRRCSDFGHDKQSRSSSQFANKLRRNSDFGNRVPRRHEPEQSKLAKILDVSPVGSRRNSDLGLLSSSPRAVESRRNSDVSCRSSERRSSDLCRPSSTTGSRRSSDISIRGRVVESQQLADIKSESDSEQPTDGYYGSEKAALVNGEGNSKPKEELARKKSLSWKADKAKDDPEDITAETSLLAEQAGRVTGADLTLHSILNHIAYVNRTKSDTPLHIPEASTAAARRAQIKKVLNVTYVTAILGIILCIADVARIYGPYGLLADSVKYGSKPGFTQFPKPWPWIIYQTVCRFLELIMGCAMASITKQPSASPRHQYLSNYPNYQDLHMRQRNNLYI